MISAAQKAAALHKPNQPDAFDMKVHFVRPAEADDIVFDIRDVSAGKRTSLVEVNASQRGNLIFVGLLAYVQLNSPAAQPQFC